MKQWLVLTALLIFSRAASGEDAQVESRVTGLFQPDRVEDLKKQFGTVIIREGDGVAEVKLVKVNYELAIVTYAYDSDAKAVRGRRPEEVRDRIDHLVHHGSRGGFRVLPLSPLKSDDLRQERIEVAGLDCKGCAYGAYRVIAAIDGVDRAIVSFKDGHVTAWIDPKKTNRQALVDELKKAQVDVIEPETATDKPKN